jgi:hypothetical protein
VELVLNYPNEDQNNGGAGEGVGTPAKQLLGHLDGVFIHATTEEAFTRLSTAQWRVLPDT